MLASFDKLRAPTGARSSISGKLAGIFPRALWAAIAFLTPAVAFAFAEDSCPSEDGGWVECAEDPCESSVERPECAAVAVLTTLKSQNDGLLGARSTAHFDATYYLAQAAGFTPRDAYYLAAYDEATDLGTFVYRGQDGQLAADPSTCGSSSSPEECALNTQAIDGVARSNFSSGGVYFHFMAPPSAYASAVNGLAPVIDDANSEPFLNHARAWAYGRGPLCVGGLSNSDNTACYSSNDGSTPLALGEMPVFQYGTFNLFDWTSNLGEQSIATDPSTGAAILASQIDTYLPADIAPIAEEAIYVHALQDRISHHRCIDPSVLNGPLPPGTTRIDYNVIKGTQELVEPSFVFHYDNNECGAGDHALRHSLETGHVQSLLAPEDQTLEPGLSYTLAELQAYALYFGFPSANNLSAAQSQQVVQAAVTALQAPNAAERANAFGALAIAEGWLPLPLYDGLSYDDWNAQAGAAFFAPQ